MTCWSAEKSSSWDNLLVCTLLELYHSLINITISHLHQHWHLSKLPSELSCCITYLQDRCRISHKSDIPTNPGDPCNQSASALTFLQLLGVFSSLFCLNLYLPAGFMNLTAEVWPRPFELHISTIHISLKNAKMVQFEKGIAWGLEYLLNIHTRLKCLHSWICILVFGLLLNIIHNRWIVS